MQSVRDQMCRKHWPAPRALVSISGDSEVHRLIQVRIDIEHSGLFLTKPAKPPPMAGRKQEVLQLRE
jgi:hypothetical protein